MSREEIEHFILAKLAEIRLEDPSILLQQNLQVSGDLEMDSEEGTCIAAGLEGIVGRQLAGPQDLQPQHFTSVRRLADLLWKNLS